MHGVVIPKTRPIDLAGKKEKPHERLDHPTVLPCRIKIPELGNSAGSGNFQEFTGERGGFRRDGREHERGGSLVKMVNYKL